jgi:hypothetical protein
MTTSPLIAGFRRGIAPQFDTSQQVSTAMPDLATIANTYHVSTRTVRRWYQSGADLSSPLAIAKHLATQKRPSIAAIRKSLEILKSNQ